MFKLLVLSCLLVSCLADPFGLPSWIRKGGREHRRPRGCADRAQGWRACAHLNSSDTLAPHGRDCSLFYYCSGARPACRKCPAGLHFNPELQVCDWPANANCARPPKRPQHNGTTPYPTTPDDDATVTVIDGSTTTDETTADEVTTDGTTTDTTDINATTTDTADTNATTTDTADTNATTTDPSVSWYNYYWGRK